MLLDMVREEVARRVDPAKAQTRPTKKARR